jgi:phosphoribosyl 1,2-cyclic phosphate phosphodiesterase
MVDGKLEITILGSGISTGVPQIGCQCEVCCSSDPHDKRLRQSALVEWCGKRIMIDCGPDFRQQILSTGDSHLDALLITHIHYDHVGGLEELRGYNELPIFARRDVIKALRERLSYCFAEHPYPGVPHFNLIEINDKDAFDCAGIRVEPIPVLHYRLPILGFKIGPLAYITDMKTINDSEMPYLEGVEVLVVNALRFTKPHHSHQLVDDAIAFAQRVGARRTLLIHMCHDVGLHEEVNQKLPEGIELAYDGQEIML